MASMLAAVACGQPPERDDTWAAQAAALAGTWQVRLEVTSRSAPGADAHGVVAGTMTLTENRTVNRTIGDVGLPTNYGTYVIDFSPFGFAPTGARVPGVFAGRIGPDSIAIRFDTDPADVAIQMRGRLSAGSIHGIWSASLSRGMVATGTFSMRRPGSAFRPGGSGGDPSYPRDDAEFRGAQIE